MQGFWYVASPYTKFPGGHDAAFEASTLECARLIDAGLQVFGAIPFSHPVANELAKMGSDAVPFSFWEQFDKDIIERSVGIIVLTLPGWDESIGVQEEIDYANSLGKPVHFLKPGGPIEIPAPDPVYSALPELRAICAAFHDEIATRGGFYDGFEDTPLHRAIKAGLIITEASELFDALRTPGKVCEKTPELTAEEEELADIAIRLFDYCGWRGVDLSKVIRIKSEVNRARSAKEPGSPRWEGKLF